jgi:uncharacterized protein YjiS (DUF1127 family)
MRDELIDDNELLYDEDDSEEMTKINPKSSKAWRSIERLREMRELRKNLDDFLFEDMPDKDLTDLHL